VRTRLKRFLEFSNFTYVPLKRDKFITNSTFCKNYINEAEADLEVRQTTA